MLVPARLRGRVLSLYVLTSIGLIPIANLVGGALGEVLGVEVVLATGGILTLTAVGLVAVLEPGVARPVRPISPRASPRRETFSPEAASRRTWGRSRGPPTPEDGTGCSCTSPRWRAPSSPPLPPCS